MIGHVTRRRRQARRRRHGDHRWARPSRPRSPTRAGLYSFAVGARGQPTTSRAEAGGCCDARTTSARRSTATTTLDFALPPRSTAFGYFCQLVPRTPSSRPTPSYRLTGDDATRSTVTLPFAFPFYGADHNTAYVATNGFMNFLAPAPSCVNTAIPDPAAPERARSTRSGTTCSSTRTAQRPHRDGRASAPNRQFVIEWRNVQLLRRRPRRRSTSRSCSTRTARSSLQYRNIDGATAGEQGSSATIGIENEAGTVGLQYSFNEAVARAPTSRFSTACRRRASSRARSPTPTTACRCRARCTAVAASTAPWCGTTTDRRRGLLPHAAAASAPTRSRPARPTTSTESATVHAGPRTRWSAQNFALRHRARRGHAEHAAARRARQPDPHADAHARQHRRVDLDLDDRRDRRRRAGRGRRPQAWPAQARRPTRTRAPRASCTQRAPGRGWTPHGAGRRDPLRSRRPGSPWPGASATPATCGSPTSRPATATTSSRPTAPPTGRTGRRRGRASGRPTWPTTPAAA